MELSVSSGLGASFIASSGALEDAFVLVDVGVRGGIHPRWLPLDPVMEIYGFDAIAELPETNKRHHYFKLALGNEDGECRFFVPDNLYEARISATGTHKVSIARLDTLWAKGMLPPADFIKIDCEGYEPEVLLGALKYLQASNLLGADIESHFHVGRSLTNSHFAIITGILIERELRVADLVMSRAEAADRPWNGTCNVLFTRHLLDEAEHQSDRDDPSPNTILKTIAVFDIYGLIGPAVALTRKFRNVISTRIDVEALHNKLLLSPKINAIEKRLPHVGLGVWTRAKKWLGR